MVRRRRHLALIGFLVLSLIAAACGNDDDQSSDASADSDANGEASPSAGDDGAGEEEKEQLTLTMGGTQSSSSMFAILTAMARIGSEIDGAMSINVRETGASVENIQLIRDGAAHFGLSGLPTSIEAHYGFGQFESEPYPELCNLVNYGLIAEYFTVRADAGIDDVEDLEGKRVFPGIQGSSAYDNSTTFLEALGIEIEVFNGSLEDGVNAMKDRRVDAVYKGGAGVVPDASILDIASAMSVKTIGFSEEQVETILSADPNYELVYTFGEVPAGSIYNDEPYLASFLYSGLVTDTSMSDDTAYRLAKAMFEAMPEVVEQVGFEGARDITVESTTSTVERFPLCPGAERYFDEVG